MSTGSELDFENLFPVRPSADSRPCITVSVDACLWNRPGTRQEGIHIPRCCARPEPALGMTGRPTDPGLHGAVRVYCQACRTTLAVLRWQDGP